MQVYKGKAEQGERRATKRDAKRIERAETLARKATRAVKYAGTK